MKHKTQKQPKPNIVRTRHYNCAYVKLMAVLIIFPAILQIVINIKCKQENKQKLYKSTNCDYTSYSKFWYLYKNGTIINDKSINYSL